MASQDLTPEALEGFAAQLDGKPVGAWPQKTGRPAPRGALAFHAAALKVSRWWMGQ